MDDRKAGPLITGLNVLRKSVQRKIADPFALKHYPWARVNVNLMMCEGLKI